MVGRHGAGRSSGLALVLGGLAVAGFEPVGWWPLVPLSLAALVRLLGQAATPRSGFLLGFLWGLGFFCLGIGWLFVALHRHGGMPAPLAVLAIVLFSAYLALYPALAAALFVRLRRRHLWADAGLFAALWAGTELLRGGVMTGFPWLSLGYSQLPPSPLGGYFALVGVYGVGAGVAALAVLAGQREGTLRARLALGLMLALGGWLAGTQRWTVPQGQVLEVALIQTNIAQALKWSPGHIRQWLAHNQALVADHPAPLVVLPETTLPVLADDLPAGYLDTLAQPVREAGGTLILGVFLRDGAGRIYNSALKLDDAGPAFYAKQHLVPFGEYSPPLFGWFYRLASIPMSNQSPGPPVQAPMAVRDQAIAVNICYEDVFGEEIIRALPQASILLNLSNLAWYGHSHAQPQHLQIARARALETGRPMLRATNTGMTAAIGPDGEPLQVLPAFETGVLRVPVQGYTGLTPYARWGNLPVIVLALLLPLALGRWRRG